MHSLAPHLTSAVGVHVCVLHTPLTQHLPTQMPKSCSPPAPPPRPAQGNGYSLLPAETLRADDSIQPPRPHTRAAPPWVPPKATPGLPRAHTGACTAQAGCPCTSPSHPSGPQKSSTRAVRRLRGAARCTGRTIVLVGPETDSAGPGQARPRWDRHVCHTWSAGSGSLATEGPKRPGVTAQHTLPFPWAPGAPVGSPCPPPAAGPLMSRRPGSDESCKALCHPVIPGTHCCAHGPPTAVTVLDAPGHGLSPPSASSRETRGPRGRSQDAPGPAGRTGVLEQQADPREAVVPPPAPPPAHAGPALPAQGRGLQAPHSRHIWVIRTGCGRRCQPAQTRSMWPHFPWAAGAHGASWPREAGAQPGAGVTRR